MPGVRARVVAGMRPRVGDRAQGSDGVTHVIWLYDADGGTLALGCGHGEQEMKLVDGPPTCLFCVARRAGPMAAFMRKEALR